SLRKRISQIKEQAVTYIAADLNLETVVIGIAIVVLIVERGRVRIGAEEVDGIGPGPSVALRRAGREIGADEPAVVDRSALAVQCVGQSAGRALFQISNKR